MPDIELITTSDGSHSLLNTKLKETYHSVHGAIRESVHVFIKKGLRFFDHLRHPAEIRILEIGFGTGLNALLTAQYALESKVRIHYTTLEAYPLEEATVRQLNYPALLNVEASDPKVSGGEAPFRPFNPGAPGGLSNPGGPQGLFLKLHAASWSDEVMVLNNFTLAKKKIKVQEWSPGREQFDLVYFDAFSPGKQPEMWEPSVLKRVEQGMKAGAVFVTYCAKGQLKRDLKSLGLLVETLPGPPGKKEMVRAVKS